MTCDKETFVPPTSVGLHTADVLAGGSHALLASITSKDSEVGQEVTMPELLFQQELNKSSGDQS